MLPLTSVATSRCSGGTKGTPCACPPTAQNLLNFMVFFENLAKSYVDTSPGRSVWGVAIWYTYPFGNLPPGYLGPNGITTPPLEKTWDLHLAGGNKTMNWPGNGHMGSPQWTEWQTDTSENITFLQLRWSAVIRQLAWKYNLCTLWSPKREFIGPKSSCAMVLDEEFVIPTAK